MNTTASRPVSEAPAVESARRATPERILQRIDWQVIRRLDGLLQGDYRSLFYGYGIDFADLREYQPEDDVRYIDWNVTARMDSPYVRQYVEDREISAWFLLDLSPSMDFGAALHGVDGLKRGALINFVATFARLLTRHGNRVGALFYSGKPAPGGKNTAPAIERTIPPRGGRVQVLHLLNDLLQQPQLPRAPFTNLTPMFESSLHAIKKRSLVFILSDFISEPGWERPLRLLAHRHEVLGVRIWDPREMELPDAGPVVLEDSETGEQLVVDTSDKKFRARFAEAAHRRENELRTTFKQSGVDLLSLSTEDDLVRAIVRLAELRKQRRAHR